ncbi:MAG TPA: hypothetical protein VFO25_08875 [Candidatus Eremiobacteraceae bacterium]|nr:hypothetical protein [Candidatus Eremiobacteraceae bacterium]
MQYTQTLRMLNGLKVLAIVFGALYVFVVIIAASNGFFAHIAHPDKQFEIPLPALFAFAGFVTCIFCSSYGRTLSEENDGHLPVVWTRPMSRIQTTLTILKVDAIGMLAAFAMYMVLAAVFITTFQVWHYVTVPSNTLAQFGRFILEPIAFYALLMAVTASTGSAGRGLIGWFWVGAIFLSILAASPIPNPWHEIFNIADFINPLAYGSYHYTAGTTTVNVNGSSALTYVAALSPATDAVALLILFAAGFALGLAQWRRLEA